ncbi:MAG: LacI family DNA-binding transcriptional regulator [Phycisphaeraceae bacterium]
MTSLRDIAEELNVSVSFVSKVLSGRMSTSSASPRMVELIHAKAEELGYRRNRVATALATGRQETIAVFIHRMGTHGSGNTEALLQGISEGAARTHQRLWLEFFRTSEEYRQRQPDVHRGDVDGLIMAGVAHASLLPEVLKAEAAGVPVVTVHNQPLHPKVPNIGSDQVEVMRLATEHLLSNGVRRPVYIGGGEGMREAGFRRALEEHGLTLEPERIFTDGRTKHPHTTYLYEEGVAAVEHWLERGIAFDGIVAASDQQAIGAMHTLLQRGFKVPEDVKLIGVDDSPLCRYAMVPLSSVSERYEEQGRQAIELLLRRIAGERVESMVIAPTVHARATSQGNQRRA